MKSVLRSYSSPFNLGHKALDHLWVGTISIQEKVDGSQFSFGIRDGELFCRSRRVAIDLEDPGMFAEAVGAVRNVQDKLKEGWTYRGEYLRTPRHNTVAYERAPNNHIILFDIDQGDQDYFDDVELRKAASRLGFEVVPHLGTIRDGNGGGLQDLKKLLETDSVLGGAKVEGIVLKNYGQYGPDKKVLMAKLVREDFVEVHGKNWAKKNPSQTAFLEQIIGKYATEARWAKAVQHLSEEGELQQVPQDIPIVMREIVSDVERECADEIRDALFKHFWPHIRRGLTKGAPVWYKQRLAELAPQRAQEG